MKCWWLFFHEWGKWETIEVNQITTEIANGKSYDTSYMAQVRVCAACGKIQRVKV